MFNIFMNYISKLSLSRDCHLMLYADDILLFKPINTNAELEDFQGDLLQVTNWIQRHGLTPNHQKTQYLPISRSKNGPRLTISLNGQTINPSSEVKYLGVTLTPNLSWSAHIENISKSSKQLLGRIHRNFRDAPKLLRHKIYKTTVLPKLDYCGAVWDPHQLKSTKLLENVQKFAGRIITQDWSSSYPFLCSSLDLKPLSIRRRMQKLKLCFKILRKESCIPPTAFTPHPQPSPRSSNSVQLFTPFVPTDAHKFSYFIDVIKHWNALPDEIVSAQNPLIFKNHLHRLYTCTP